MWYPTRHEMYQPHSLDRLTSSYIKVENKVVSVMGRFQSSNSSKFQRKGVVLLKHACLLALTSVFARFQ
jgi:hypothetical protein